MGANVPGWLEPVAEVFLVLCVLSLVALVVDIYGRGHRQAVPAMDVVWPLTALYLGPFALVLYARKGRRGPTPAEVGASAPPLDRALLGLPGGAASAVAHLVGVPLVAATGWTVAGTDMWAMIAVIAVLVLVALFVVEACTTAGVTGQRRADLSTSAATAAVVLVGFDLGMVGWMVLLDLGGFMPPVTQASFWLLMQVGVVIGLGTAHPVIRRLADRNSSSSLVAA